MSKLKILMFYPDHIFKAYDIRGLVDTELNEDLFYRIGCSAVVFTGAKLVYVGYDMRPSSIPYKEALIRGLVDQGADVVDIGLVSTPMLNIMTIRDSLADLGIMITASHNPQQYNGCKFMYKKTMMPIGLESGLLEIKDLVNQNKFVSTETVGTTVSRDLKKDYVDYTLSLLDITKIKPLKVVMDFGNGIEGELIDGFVSRLPIEAEYMYKEPDGTFPNHEANPIKHETLKDLQAKIVETNADLGFAFDADGDRLGLVDETGSIVSGDRIMALLAPEILKKYPTSTIVFEVKCGRIVPEIVKQFGGQPLESKVGRTLIIEKMRERDASFGGELSGHFYFKDLHGFESDDLALLYLLKIVSESGKKLSELVAPLNQRFHSGEINFEVEDKDKKIAELKQKYAGSANHISELDGVKIEFGDWWFGVRKSNTEPLLRMVLEADTKDLMDEKVAEVRSLVEAV